MIALFALGFKTSMIKAMSNVTRRHAVAAFFGANSFLPALLSAAPAKGKFVVYVGTYTRGKSKGIYAYHFDAATGDIKELGLAAEVDNPSFVNLHPNGKFLYAVSESSPAAEKRDGFVTAYSIDTKSGKLTKLNDVLSGGGGPCHLVVDKTGKTLLVANYGTGSVASFPINADGSLKPAATVDQHKGSSMDEARQKGPHAHSVNLSKDNKFLVVGDLGLDQVMIYKLNAAAGTITANDPPYAKVAPGSGPRHFSFHPSGKFGYVINEMNLTVTAFNWNAGKGTLTEMQTIATLPEGAERKGASTAEILVHPSGKWLYGSNRGHDTIAQFNIAADGKLTAAGHTPTQGQIPRNFRIDPTGNYLFAANQNSDNIVLFRIDQTNGKLTPTGKQIMVGAPVSIRFLAVK